MNADGLVRQWTDVHGIETAPVRDVVDGHPRKIWRRDGIDVVESFTILGMAHGTPLATGEKGCGQAGAFLLDVGISSSSHIATFFGLIDPVSMQARQPARRTTAPAFSPVANDTEVIPDERVEILDREAVDREPVFETAADRRIDVMAVITNALKSAGLIKPT
jgi:feruloyl esterase